MPPPPQGQTKYNLIFKEQTNNYSKYLELIMRKTRVLEARTCLQGAEGRQELAASHNDTDTAILGVPS